MMLVITNQSDLIIALLDMTTNGAALGTRVETIRYQQIFLVPLTLVGQNLAKYPNMER